MITNIGILRETVTMVVEVRGWKVFGVRFVIAKWLFRLAAHILGCGIEVIE
jgi:hypothetical protein